MKSVLIVDQDLENRRRMTMALKHWGYQVAEAAEGADAVQLAQTSTPDLLMVAAILPDMTGYDLCRQLRSLERTKERPVILMTSIDDNATRIKGARVQVNAYLLSPVVLSELFERARYYVAGTDVSANSSSKS